MHLSTRENEQLKSELTDNKRGREQNSARKNDARLGDRIKNQTDYSKNWMEEL